MARYYRVDRDTYAWEAEVPGEDASFLWQTSSAETNGHTKTVDEIIYEVEDDSDIAVFMYRIGNVWTSVPTAFQDMILNINMEDSLTKTTA